jgi:FkbM family methyltransferase
MNQAKNALKKLLAAAGYELRKRSQIGLDDINDVRQILGNPPAKTIIDVGGHEGQTATRYAEGFPEATIYSLEPFSESFAKLEANTRQFSNVKPFNLAMGNAEETRLLNVNQFSATNSLLAAVHEVKEPHTRQLMQSVRQVTIRVQKLDSFCQQADIEFEVLDGGESLLRRRRVALIYSEITFESLYVGQATFAGLHAHLVERGFELVDLYGQTRGPTKSIRWCDMLFVNSDALRTRN